MFWPDIWVSCLANFRADGKLLVLPLIACILVKPMVHRLVSEYHQHLVVCPHPQSHVSFVAIHGKSRQYAPHCVVVELLVELLHLEAFERLEVLEHDLQRG